MAPAHPTQVKKRSRPVNVAPTPRVTRGSPAIKFTSEQQRTLQYESSLNEILMVRYEGQLEVEKRRESASYMQLVHASPVMASNIRMPDQLMITGGKPNTTIRVIENGGRDGNESGDDNEDSE